jgi:hypothetical protein
MENRRRNRTRRRVLYVDSDVQGAIITRVLMYWSACLLFLTLPIILVMTVAAPSVPWIQHLPTVVLRFWPMYVIMIVLLPFLIRDALTLSHRFCGPITRVLKSLNDFNETGVYEDMIFRDQDFWKPVATAINLSIAKAARHGSGAATAGSDEQPS